jgi:hypothetical protein
MLHDGEHVSKLLIDAGTIGPLADVTANKRRVVVGLQLGVQCRQIEQIDCQSEAIERHLCQKTVLS